MLGECGGDGRGEYKLCHYRGGGDLVYGFVPLLLQCRTPYAAVHTLVLLMMGITMPETC